MDYADPSTHVGQAVEEVQRVVPLGKWLCARTLPNAVAWELAFRDEGISTESAWKEIDPLPRANFGFTADGGICHLKSVRCSPAGFAPSL
jgi:hypothetical protein